MLPLRSPLLRGLVELTWRCHSVYAMNGKSVEIDNTDAEGRLVLSGTSYAILCSCRELTLHLYRCDILRLERVQA